MQTSLLGKKDLCSNCMHNLACSHRSNEVQIVKVCEEHVSEIGRHVRSQTNGNERLVDTSFGLCANCEHQTDCMLPEKNKKVTQCEEYK